MVTKLKQKNPIIPKAAVPLLTRTVVFLVVFIIFSGTIGPLIIGHGLVGKDGFQIYGGAGKSLLFGMLAFLLLVWRNDSIIQLKRWSWPSGIWLILAALTLAGAWLSVYKLIDGAHAAIWPLLVHVCLVASIVFAAGGTFGPSNLRMLGKVYKKELLTALVIATLFYGFLYAVYGLWRVLAIIVLHGVSWLLGLIGIHSTSIPPHTLVLSKFGISVSKYCSGIDSIALFSGLYVVVGLMDWGRFNHRRFLLAFAPALLFLFCFNILRVFLLILGGYYINTRIAFSLFHTYAGMIFFILYSILFWAVSYRWMLRKD